MDGYAWRGLLHTTEGKTYGGAKAAYASHRGWPHFTVAYPANTFKAYQHIDTARAARALKNPTGGVQTNRARCIQIEIVGTCQASAGWGSQYVGEFPRGYLNGIARLMRWIEATHGVKRSAVTRWKPFPASFGLGNGVRIPAADWPVFGGWCGHQHAPENDHGDPGLIDIAYLLGPAITGDGLDMTPEEVRAIVREEVEHGYRRTARGEDRTGEISPTHRPYSLIALRELLDQLIAKP